MKLADVHVCDGCGVDIDRAEAIRAGRFYTRVMPGDAVPTTFEFCSAGCKGEHVYRSGFTKTIINVEE